MMKRVQAVKNEKGLTLIELLVVIVILGIIAAIAVVAIGGIIENSKKDNVVGNAQQMISAAKLAVAGGNIKVSTTNTPVEVTAEELQEWGYLDPFKGPNGDDPDTAIVTLEAGENGVVTYKVNLEFKGYKINASEDKILKEGRGVVNEKEE